MSKQRRYIIGGCLAFLAIGFLFAGCQQQFDDISSNENYAHLIDTRYQSLQVLRLQGIRTDRNSRDSVDYYTLTTSPGYDGREVISIRYLSSGIEFTINQILRCNNCFFGAPEFFHIDILSEDIPTGIPTRLYGLKIEGADGRVELDPNYFRAL